MERTSITRFLLALLVLDVASCAPSASKSDASTSLHVNEFPAEASVTESVQDAKVTYSATFGSSSPVWPYTINGVSAGFSPNLIMPGTLQAGQISDLNSLVWGDIAQPDIAALSGSLLQDAPHVQANLNGVTTPQGNSDAVWINNIAFGSAMTQAFYFSAIAGVSTYALEADIVLPTGCSAGSVNLAIENAAGSSTIVQQLCTETTSFQTCSSGNTSALVAGTTYQGQLQYNQNGSTGTCGIATVAEAVISRIRIRPVTASSPLLSAPFIRYNASPNLLWDNARNTIFTALSPPVVMREVSSMSSLKFLTNATEIGVQTFNNFGTTFAQIGVYVNGKAWANINPAYQVYDFNTVSLPLGTNLVELVSSGSGNQSGDFVQSVIAPQANMLQILTPPENPERWLWYGDSKCYGYGAPVPANNGLIPLLRRQLTGTVASECWTGRSMWSETYNNTQITYLVARFGLYHATKFVNQIGRNDWADTLWPSVATFQGVYGQVLDQEHGALPGTPTIIVMTTWPEANTSAVNGNGETLLQYMSAEQAECAKRAAWCFFVDGTAIADFNTTTMLFDGVHPNAIGYGDIVNTLVSSLQSVNQDPNFGVPNIPTYYDDLLNVTVGATYTNSTTVQTGLQNTFITPSRGTVNSQTQKEYQSWGTAETVSSATPTPIVAGITVTGRGGWLHVTLVSVAVSGGCGSTGDSASAEYVVGFKNVGGTVSLSTAGLTLVGSVQTTNAALTSTLTATVATNVLTLNVVNPAGCTVDSEVVADVVQN
jgi:lysophospholipase L1-like esterase